MKMWERTGSNAEHVSKQLQKYHKLADLRCCICFFFYSHGGSSKAKKYNTCELNCEMAFTGEETTQAVNHHLERGVCRGGERRWMGLGGLDGPLTLGTRAVRMVLLTTLNTALLWFTAMNPRAQSGHLCFLVLVWALPWVLYEFSTCLCSTPGKPIALCQLLSTACARTMFARQNNWC